MLFEFKSCLYRQRRDIYGEGKCNVFGEGHMRAGSLYKAISLLDILRLRIFDSFGL